MMTMKEIYERFDKIGCVAFSTQNGGLIESRIAHFLPTMMTGCISGQ